MRGFLSNGLRRFSTTLDALLDNLSRTGRGRKQALGALSDALVATAALWLAYSLRHGQAFSDFRATWHLFILIPLVTVLIFAGLGVYRWVVRSTNRRLFRELAKGCVIASLSVVVITFLLPGDRVNPRSIFALFGMLLFLGSTGTRGAWQSLFGARNRGEPIAIYGAGAAGRQLAGLLGDGVEFRPVVFIDDDVTLHGRTVAGLTVLNGNDEQLRTVLRRFDASRLVLAIPSVTGADYRRLISRAEELSLPLQTMPGIDELVNGGAQPDQIRDISIGDILGRAEVLPDLDLIGQCVVGRTVLVTGGGGSIGSELCRQISRLTPKRLIVLDSSEENLYHITEEFKDLAIDFLPHLGSVTDRVGLERLMATEQIDTIYHAAAYKHVPVIEAQPARGVETNVFGTLAVLETAIDRGVSNFVLISTDKAVRPANAMGASKRVAELVLQAKARSNRSIRISMVRFGNVLGSSGSVVPKFKKQIEAGGPVTLTHPEITRFFMTIPEAAQLVLQASAIANGGDVFVLDMGEPVKIIDLARTMVRLYGKRLQEDTGNPRDIEIVMEGLRPGEKMYEELFIGDGHRPTTVGKVFTAEEIYLSWSELAKRLDLLVAAMAKGDDVELKAALMKLSLAGHSEQPQQTPDYKKETGEPAQIESTA